MNPEEKYKRRFYLCVLFGVKINSNFFWWRWMSSILESIEYRKKKVIFDDVRHVAITDFCEQYYIRKHLRIYRISQKVIFFLFLMMSGMLLWEPIVGDGGQIQSCLLTLRWLLAAGSSVIASLCRSCRVS